MSAPPGAVSIGVITNPNSKKNRAHRGRAAELQRILGGRGVVRETRSVDEIAPAIREMLDKDVRYWVSDGGDGALHWLVNEARSIFAERGVALPLTVPTNGGTIDFVAKKVGIKGQADEILRRLVDAQADGRAIPVEEVASFIMTGERREPGGRTVPFERVGFVAAVAGIGQRFFDLYYEDPLPGPDTLVRVIAKGVASIALNAPVVSRLPIVPAEWRGYVHRMVRPQRARVRVDGETLPLEQWRGLHVGAIFANIGGVVRLFPLASGGKLHIMYGCPSMLDILTNLPNLFLGRPMTRGMTERAVSVVEVEAEGDELLNPVIDGEIFRDLVRLKIEPGPHLKIPRV